MPIGKSTSALRMVVLACMLLGSTYALIGCGGGNSANSDPSKSNLAAFSILYARFRIANRGKNPQNEQELRSFIESKGSTVLEAAGLSVDDVFVSDRDNERIVVVYGDKPLMCDGQEVIAYESTSVDGERLIASPTGSAMYVSEATFSEAE